MNQGWETWVPRMAYFLSSFAIIFFLLTVGKKSEGQQYTSAGYQLSNKELVSWSLSSTFVTKPLSFILYCHCNLCLASLSFLFSNRPLCMPHNFKLFKTWHHLFLCSLYGNSPGACPVSVALSQREGGRDPPQSVGHPGLPPFPSPIGAVKLVAYITQLAFSS